MNIVAQLHTCVYINICVCVTSSQLWTWQSTNRWKQLSTHRSPLGPHRSDLSVRRRWVFFFSRWWGSPIVAIAQNQMGGRIEGFSVSMAAREMAIKVLFFFFWFSLENFWIDDVGNALGLIRSKTALWQCVHLPGCRTGMQF